MNNRIEIYQKNYWEREDLNKRRSPQHKVIREYVVPRIDLLRRYLDITKQTSLLDVGCGNGFFTYYFDKICNTCGVDYSKKMLQINPVKKVFLMDANNLGFEDNSFDVVFCDALLHHVENIDDAIKEMKRVSRKYVVILEPNRNNPLMFLFSFLVKEERNALKFSLSYLKNRIKDNGLEVINSFSYGIMPPNKTPSFLLFLMQLSNFRQPFGITNFIISKKIL
ncbi:class I SAM-dependent methyltransferase [Patescibacteria group bacterium]